jgi:hypothetical protein
MWRGVINRGVWLTPNPTRFINRLPNLKRLAVNMTTFSNVAVEPRLSEKDYLFIKRLEMEHNLMVVEHL